MLLCHSAASSAPPGAAQREPGGCAPGPASGRCAGQHETMVWRSRGSACPTLVLPQGAAPCLTPVRFGRDGRPPRLACLPAGILPPNHCSPVQPPRGDAAANPRFSPWSMCTRAHRRDGRPHATGRVAALQGSHRPRLRGASGGWCVQEEAAGVRCALPMSITSKPVSLSPRTPTSNNPRAEVEGSPPPFP
jgi:hypothetical protein